ncbi:NfeD family protein [Nocardioides sp. JQ2195]|uniref:NfeD family protein n=1 Tax=Nocardioides sp. JQ2195 TaxID=2592334 RepID=UPI00143EE9E0|nr:NfeD family protein [Nocardioides sp. JQ2195]QIX26760.1 NfeD family protein [Nocardioides sp. JQ2195]
MDWLRDHAWETWLGLTIVLGVAELFSMDLILLMLAAGAGVGMISALLGAPLVLQVILAAIAAVASLAVVRPTALKRLHSGPELSLGHAKLVGERAVALTEISDQQAGRIRLDGQEWTAKPYDETLVIAPGDPVEVLQIKGATAMVHPVPRLES